jgi:hypothetical protein
VFNHWKLHTATSLFGRAATICLFGIGVKQIV